VGGGRTARTNDAPLRAAVACSGRRSARRGFPATT
jgi:hypothetical protein